MNVIVRNQLTRQLVQSCRACVTVRCASTMKDYVPFGTAEPLRVEQKYATGQLFLHKVFGYRGVILVPWSGHLYDRDANVKAKPKETLTVEDEHSDEHIDDDAESSSKESDTTTTTTHGQGQLEFTDVTYYQTLIHEPDATHIVRKMNPDSITYLGPAGILHALPCHDYACHDDIIPYISKDNEPIQHHMFDKFFDRDMTREPWWQCTTNLHAWVSNSMWLEIRDVHSKTTNGVRVTVMPFFLGERTEERGRLTYWWRYNIRIENLMKEKVQLKHRSWKIFDVAGHMTKVNGAGVVGNEPMLSTFQYSSWVDLPVPGGQMWGEFRMERSDGSSFEVQIPAFPLERSHSLER